MKEEEYESLGYANGWGNYPDQVKEALEKGYELKETILRPGVIQVVCDELKFKYYVDCSD